MSSLRAPGLGPIIGHTTSTSARIWVRADPENDDAAGLDSETRTIGVIAILSVDGTEPVKPECYYFRLRREFDRSGTITLGGDKGTKPLKADSRHVVRVGTLLLDDPIDDDDEVDWEHLKARLPSPQAWLDDLKRLPENKCQGNFRTFPEGNGNQQKLDFLLGSCRYPGLLWKVRHSDRIFSPMSRMAEDTGDASPPRFTLMVGDQIYADLYNRYIPIGRADTYEEFRERYLTAFASRNIRRLMRHAPTYMILDDHEIEDNWTQDRVHANPKSRLLFTTAIDAYLSYQWSHGPRSFGKRLYYHFDCGDFPFFVLDTRTQRYIDLDGDGLDDNHLLGPPTLPGSPPGQLLRLLNWLRLQQKQHGNAPKFIVTASVFAPNPMSGRNGKSDKAKVATDSWPGFPNTRASILQCIIDNDIQNVVFLSGDIHCANVAELNFSGTDKAKAIKAFSVTSSAFYWPFPFADGEPSDYVHDSRAKGQEDPFGFKDENGNDITMHYTSRNYTQEDNFCRISIDRQSGTLTVCAYDKNGNLVEEEDDRDKKHKLKAKMKLTAW